MAARPIEISAIFRTCLDHDLPEAYHHFFFVFNACFI